MVLIVSVALKPPLILLSGGRGAPVIIHSTTQVWRKEKLTLMWLVGFVNHILGFTHVQIFFICLDILWQFSFWGLFLRRQESVPDCPTSGQLSTFWQFFWEIHSHWCLAASLAITFFPNVFQPCTAIDFKMMMFQPIFKIRAWAFSLLVKHPKSWTCADWAPISTIPGNILSHSTTQK